MLKIAIGFDAIYSYIKGGKEKRICELIIQEPGSASNNHTFEEKDGAPLEVEKKTTELSQQEDSRESEITQAGHCSMKRMLNWRTIIPLNIVFLALASLAKEANINPQKTWASLRRANVLLLLSAFLMYYLCFLIRASRWRMRLQNMGYTKANGGKLPGFWKLLEILYISCFANAIVPYKLEDLYRAYPLCKGTNLPTSRMFGTVLVERLLDLIVLLSLSIPAVIISLHENLPPQLQARLKVTLVLVVCGIGLIEGAVLTMIALFTSNHNLAAAAILFDRAINLFRILITDFMLFIVAFGRDARKAAIQAFRLYGAIPVQSVSIDSYFNLHVAEPTRSKR